MVVRLRGQGTVRLPIGREEPWTVALTTEDAKFAENGRRPVLSGHAIAFACPAAVILTRRPPYFFVSGSSKT